MAVDGSEPLTVRVVQGTELVAVDPRVLAWAEAARGLCFGAARAPAALVSGRPGEVAVPRDLARRLGLPAAGEGLRLRVRWDGDHLRLGPLIGILTWRRRQPAPFGADTPLIAGMARLAAAEGALVYAFTCHDLRPRERRVRGYVLDPLRGRWRRRLLPLADAVYDRLTSRRAAFGPRGRRVRAFLSRVLGERYFNPTFWDKWRVHRVLARSGRWRELLPATAPYRGGRQLAGWLARYGTVWLKPRQGTGGLGILVVRCAGPGQACVQRARGGGELRVPCRPAPLAEAVARLKRRGPYLVQEGIPLARYGGRPFDVRVLAQKDGSGAWRRTKVFARVAGPGALISNISAGGQGIPVSRALAGSGPAVRRRARALRAELRRLAEELPPELERLLGEPMGEVGLDLAVDVQGRLRFIEANAKPFRLAATLTGSQELVRLSLLRPVQYAAYLAGFPSPAQGGGAACPASPAAG